MPEKARQCLSFIFGLLLPLALQAAPGDRSTTFGTAGIARDGNVVFHDSGERVLSQPDGKVVMVGFRQAISGADTNRKFSVWRFNSDASRDSSFGPGSNGQVVSVVSTANDEVGAAALQPDGKILVAGSRVLPSVYSGKPAWLVTRFTAAGDLDSTFGGGTRDYIIEAGAVLQKIESIALQPDGAILLGGYPNALMRVTSSGAPDATFGGNGIVRPPFDGAVRGIAVQADGKILVSGGVSGANSGAAVMRFNTDGTLDTGFASGGQFLLPNLIAKGVAVQPDGGILLGFSDNANGGTAYFALRLLADGTRDMAFGGAGTASFSAGASVFHGASNRIPVASDGSFALGGHSPGGGFTLARFGANGQQHGSFANYAGSPFGGLGTAIDVALQADGKALLTGFAPLSASEAMVVRINAAGALDATFNDIASPVAGVAAFGLDCAGNAVPGGMAAAPAGGVYIAYGGGCSNGNLTLARMDATGQIDAAFSGGTSPGISSFFFPGNATSSRAVAVQADGFVVAGGSVNAAASRDFALVRVNPSGVPDAGFGSGGKVVFSPTAGANELYALAVQPDGKILAAGTAGNDGVVVRFSSNGSVDSSFAGGMAVIPGARVNAMTLQADGAILLGVTPAAGGSAVYRLLASGLIDTAFGIGGSVTTADEFGVQGLAVLSDGAIVAAGTNWIRKWSSAGVPRGFSAITPALGVHAMAAGAGDRILMLVPNGTGGAMLRRLLASGVEDAGFSSGNVLAGVVNPGALGMALQGSSVFVAGQKVDGYVPVVAVDNQLGSTPGNPQEFQLDVVKNGNGRVTGATIDCGAVCSAAFNEGTVVTLTAVASANNTFTGWTGACEGTANPCIVTMSAARSVTASFAGQQFQLTVDFSSTGSGSVSSVPAGISCTTLCQANFAADTVVTLTATPAAGSRFAGWSGDCTNATGTCTVTMNRGNVVTARFDQTPTLTITLNGTGSGAVSSAPAGIDCGSTCEFEFGFGTEVTLTATPAAGSVFNSWSGICAGNPGPCTVTMNQARSINANFTAGTFAFTLDGPPAPHHFTAVSGALSASIHFVLTNTGNLSLQGIASAVSSNAFLWGTGTSCGAILAPGDSCNIVLTLGPAPGTTAVSVNAELIINSTNAGQIASIPISGQVVLATATAQPVTLNFTAPAGAAASSQTVTFTATNGAVANIAVLLAPSPFAITADNCTGLSLAIGQSCTVSVAFTAPATVGSYNQSLQFEVAANFGASMGRATLVSANLAGASTTPPPTMWTITPSASGPGTISPSAPFQVGNGAGYGINIQVEPGYHLTTGGTCNGTLYDLGGGAYLFSGAAALADCTFNATFSNPPFTITVGPSAGGTVTSQPPGINCRSGGVGVCSAIFPGGSTVQIIPTPDTNWVVGGYAGCPVPAGTGVCSFTVSGNTSMNVGFTRVAVNFNIIKAGTGSGTVTATGIDCGSTCAATVPSGQNLTLTATPAAGSSFRGFTGYSCSPGNTCAVDTGSDHTITATFDSDNATFTVTSTQGSGPGTFMDILATIYDAAGNFCLPGTKTILFNISAATDPGCSPATGICVVQVPENFHARCGELTIDGYSQPGASPNTATDRTNNAQIKIEFDGPGASNARSMVIGRSTTHPFGSQSGNNVVVRGIAFPRHALEIVPGGSGSVLGGGSGHVVSGNLFGWHAEGTRATGIVSKGIRILGAFMSGLRIGGPTPADRNLLTHRDAALCCEAGSPGISAEGVESSTFEGNYFNIGRDGQAVVTNGIVGGINVSGGLSGGTPYSRNNVIRRNVIANSAGTPIGTGAGSGNTVSENLHMGHPAHLPAINFFSIAAGGSNPQLPPVVNSVQVSASQVLVSGTVTGDVGGTVRLEFFSGPAAFTGISGQVDTFHGNLDLVMDANGQGTFSKTLPAGAQHVGVTATRMSTGDTSMFSNYVTPVPQQTTARLTVTSDGSAVTRVQSQPAGINCNPTCTMDFDTGTQVTLNAAVSSGSNIFLRWEGACSGSEPVCVVNMDAAKQVSAFFGQPQPAITFSPAGPLVFTTFSGVPSAIQSVTLTSSGNTAVAEYSFLGPQGSGNLFEINNNCPSVIPVGASCTANFRFLATAGMAGLSSSGEFLMRTMTRNLGVIAFNITVNSPQLTSMPSSLSFSANAGTSSAAQSVTFTAVNGVAKDLSVSPLNAPFQITGDQCTGATLNPGQSCTVSVVFSPSSTAGGSTVSQVLQLDVAANSLLGNMFRAPISLLVVAGQATASIFALNVNKAGNGSGTVTSAPAGINCGATCSTSAVQGSVFTLSAVPASGSRFAGWSGACTGTAPSCTVTLNAAKSVTASFAINDTTVPIAIIDGPATGKTGVAVNLSGAASADLTGGIVEYRWSFTGTRGASLQTSALVSSSPIFTITALTPGIFRIRLVVVDGAGNTSAAYTHEFRASDTDAPVAVLRVTPVPVVLGNKVTLSGEESFDVGGAGVDIYSYSIAEAPPGSMYAASDPVATRNRFAPSFNNPVEFTPDVTGSWRFKLVVRDGLQNSSVADIVTVPVLADGKPTAIINGPDTGKINVPIAFDGSASAGSSAGQPVTQYTWSVTRRARGSSVPLNMPVQTASPVFSLTPDRLGIYNISLEVRDSGGHKSEVSVATVRISDTDQPVAVFDIKPLPAYVNEDVKLIGNESFDVGGSGIFSLTYKFLEIPQDAFNFRQINPLPNSIRRLAIREPRGGVLEELDVNAAFRPDIPGIWRVQLTATDNVLLESEPVIIDLPVLVRNTPTAIISGPATGQFNVPVALDGSESNSGGAAAIMRYRWKIERAPADSARDNMVFDSAAPGFTFTPDLQGIYVVCLKIEIAGGSLSDQTCKRVQVASAGIPVAVLEVTPSPAVVGQLVKLRGGDSFSNDGYALDRYGYSVVERPAGSTAFDSPVSRINPNTDTEFVPDKPGVWRIRLTVRDAHGTSSDPVQVALAVFASVPAAPTNVVATAGLNRATIAFDAAVDNGAAITGYSVTCESAGATTRSATGTASPIVVTGLVNDRVYACRVTATNSVGTGPASATVNVTPVEPFGLDEVVSRKSHGLAGNFDLRIDHTEPITGNVSVEPRTKGTTHSIVFRFNQPVLAVGSATVKGPQGQNVGTFSIDPTGNEVEVTLSGIVDRSRVIVRLNDVNGKLDVSAALGFLVGDVNGTRSINALDLSIVKSRSGQTANANNFRNDINASGSITSADVLVVKARNGLTLP